MSTDGNTDKTAIAIDALIDCINGQVMRTIDTISAFDHSPRELLCIDAGKALILLGCSFMGNAMGIRDPEAGLKPALDCIAQFRKFAESEIAKQQKGGA